MDKIIIRGGRKLKGTVSVSGSKNAVLPIMCAALLADGQYTLTRVPSLKDVDTMKRLLACLGVSVETDEHTMVIKHQGVSEYEAPYNLVKTMRASIYALGPLLTRYGYAKVSMPGGCAWGPRPINLHIENLKKMGAKIDLEKGYIVARTKRLKGTRIVFDVSSVGATGNCLMAAVLAKGSSIIENAAREPEIIALATFLNTMGARIQGAGTDKLEIQGVDSLQPADAHIIPDRIEAGTFLIAGMITAGEVRLQDVESGNLTAVLEKLQEAGAHIQTGDDYIHLRSCGRIRPVDVTTAVYPGFPTDMQAQWMALMSLAGGSSVITDTIYLDRFTHVAELRRLGADIILDHNTALVRGVDHLSGAPVMSTDLRASASLILAGLAAKGQTDISRVYHIDRGYESIEKKLRMLGADIQRDTEKLAV
ncbi:MAG TPA: UDP-N-acetylglucosamine 1-carboxyvinyltransferase [bacterium]|nr:UDP-N-acetylglucosamine 1-carboxyvinyltransferase [bacterium]